MYRQCFAHSFIHSVNLTTSSFNLNSVASLARVGINWEGKFKERVLGSAISPSNIPGTAVLKVAKHFWKSLYLSSHGKSEPIEFLGCPEKRGVEWDLVFMCVLTSRQVLHLYMCMVSIPQLAMWISVSPLLIQAGQRGCQISRTILKYSTAVRD